MSSGVGDRQVVVTDLQTILQSHVSDGSVAGAVALVARGDQVEIEAAGSVDVEGTAPMARDSIFRIASITKPITAAAVMMLVEDGQLALGDPIARWLPEMGALVVVRTPDSPLDDVVPAARPITVEDLLTSCAGYGFGPDFDAPAIQALSPVQQGPLPAAVPPPDDWLLALSRIPMLHQPGAAWLYNTCSDLQGVLIARASGGTLPDFLTERLFDPLGMVDTGFQVPPGEIGRFTSYYRPGPAGLDLLDAPDGQWSHPPAFPSVAGGLVSTLADQLSFYRMLLAGGTAAGRAFLSPASVAAMTTDHLTIAQREACPLFLEGQGWGYGGSVDVAAVNPWTVPGRYGWVGGTGTAAHMSPSTGTVTILLSQLELGGPASTTLMNDFWRTAATT